MSQTQAEIYKDNSISPSDIAANSIASDKLQDGAVTFVKLADVVKPTPFTTRGFNIPL